MDKEFLSGFVDSDWGYKRNFVTQFQVNSAYTKRDTINAKGASGKIK